MERENRIGAVPVHVGIIMDGNGRWATKRGKPRSFGHAEGVKTMEKVIGYADEAGIKVLSLYVFSTENINRPEEEVSGLFSLAEKYFSRTKELVRRNYRVTVSGSVTKLPYDLVIKFREAERLTSCNTGLTVNFCFNYGGRDEIVHAFKRMAAEGLRDIDEEKVSEYMYSRLPDPDFIIRTGGMKRLSNFLIYQAAYAELYFTDVLWPDFSRKDFFAAIEDYGKRKRSFGRLK